jgi:tetratricopeptide (TPR) repeat protein
MEDWFNVGLALYEQSKYDEVLKSYDESIRLDQNVPSVWYNKGIDLAALGNYSEAIQAYDRAIEINSAICRSLAQQRQCSS